MGTIKRSAVLLAIAGVGAVYAVRELGRRNREISLHGRVVLITGGSRGLGLLLAKEFARQGAHIALCARDQDELDRARRELLGREAVVFTTTCDLTDKAQIDTMVDEVRRHYGHIDVLVNNAGTIEVGPMELMTETDFDEAMRLHFWAPLHTTLAVLPEMKRRRLGRIVNIASVGGKVSVPHLLPYSASKFALVGLSEGMRAELAKASVYVTTVCPGLMRTGSQEHATFKGQNALEYAGFSTLATSPVTSMDAELAAQRIVAACRCGEAELILSPQAQLLSAFHGLFPGLTSEILGLVNQLLPGSGGIGKRKASGSDSHMSMVPSSLVSLPKPTRANNEAP